MCGRFVSATPPDEIATYFGAEPAGDEGWSANYNVAPTTGVLAVRDDDGARRLETMRWGLVPFWAKGVPPKLSTINARVETVATAASYRGPWKRGQRCILPATGFYEWQLREAGKQPFFIHLTDQTLFGLAGLWDASTNADRAVLESCTILTMPANPLMAEIHNAKARMPAILRREDHDAWLAGDADAAMNCIAPYPQELMRAYPVSTVVNSPRNNEARLIEPLGVYSGH